MDSEEYPSWRDALFSDDKIANLRCAAKYSLWHGAYVVLAVIGIVLVGGAKVLDKLSRKGGNKAVGKVQDGLGHPKTKKAGRILFTVITVGYIGGLLVISLYLYIQLLLADPITTLFWTVAIVVGFLGAVVGIAVLGPPIKRAIQRALGRTASGFEKAGGIAQKTPGLRRVWGECPVHMDLEPKWFDNIFGDK